MPARNVGINSTFEQQRQVINSIAEDVFTLTSSIVGFGSTGITVDVDYAPNAGVATYSQTSGIATYAATAGIVSYANLAGVATYASTSGSAVQAQTAAFADVVGVASYSSISGIATYAVVSGVATYASVSGISTYSSLSGSASIASYSPVAGFATVAANLTGVPNLNVGILTASKFVADDAEFTGILTAQSLKSSSGYILSPDNQQSIRIFSSSGSVTFPLGIGSDINVAGIITGTKLYGDASNVTGIVTDGISSIVAGGNIIVQQTGNVAIVTAVLAGGGGGFFEGGTAGIGTTSAVGIGTTIPTEKLTVKGNVSVTGNIILTGEISSPTRIKFGSGGENIKIGDLTGGFGSANVAIGDQALGLNNGGLGHNIAIGQLSYYAVTSGQYNIGLGDRAGQNLTTGSYNVIIGSYNGQTGLDIRTSSNNVVIADGAGNIRQYINSSGNVGFGTIDPSDRLTVSGRIQIQQDSGSNNRIVFRGQPSSSYRWSIDNYSSNNEFRIFREDDATAANGFVAVSISTTGTLNATKFSGDGSLLTGITALGSGIQIKDDDVLVGTAATVNFGSNLNVTLSSGIATVSGNGLATYANISGIATYASTAGISTTSSYATSSGISTYASSSGISTYATSSGISSSLIATASVNTSGIITASSFSGSGSGLTNLPAAQLTGSLPAIDGSALINVTASGTGIVVEDNNVNVGSAVTVNFGTGLDVTFSSGIATVSSSGGSLQSRITVSGVTTSIPNLGIGNTDITGFKSYSLMKVGLSTAGWIRLYTDSTSRTNDVTRSVGEDPAPGSGVIAEVVTTGISTQQIITPFVMGGNMDTPVTDKIYVAITNLSGSTQTITANLTILQLEA
jgi:hypothetical protein